MRRQTACPFRNILTCQDRTQTMADQVVTWLTEPQTQQPVREQLRRLKAEFARPGASRRAADYLWQELQTSARPAPRPHVILPPAA